MAPKFLCLSWPLGRKFPGGIWSSKVLGLTAFPEEGCWEDIWLIMLNLDSWCVPRCAWVGVNPPWVPTDTEDYFLPHFCAPAYGFSFALYIPLLFASISTPLSTFSALCGFWLFPGGSDVIESACNAGDMGSIWVGKIPRGGGHSNPLQCLCLENSMVRGVGVVQSVGSQRIADDWRT